MKKFLFVLTLFFAVSMVALAQSQVLTGTWSAGPGTAQYTLDKNEGDRSVVISVEFDTPFETKPDVMLGITMLDATSATNVRYKVEALSVSRDGMTIKISTWADTRIFGIQGYWLAHAEGM